MLRAVPLSRRKDVAVRCAVLALYTQAVGLAAVGPFEGSIRRRAPVRVTLRTTHRASRDADKRLRLRRLLLLAPLLAVTVALNAVYWSWIDAQARAVVVLSSILETPVLTPVVEGVTDKPRFVDTYIAGNPAFVVKPRGEGPYPAVFFVNGIVTQGRK